MKVIHNSVPGKVMSLGTYLRFIPDDKKKAALSVEPDYSLEFGPGGFTVIGYVRKKGLLTFEIETNDFYLDVAYYAQAHKERLEQSSTKKPQVST